MGPATGRIVYFPALLFGLVLAAFIFPMWALTGGVPPGAPPGADFAQQVIGQRYFLPAPWHWPLLLAPGPVAPWGVDIAFTDSNPLAALAAKLLRPALPAFDQVVTVWQALCWILQPAAAIFALRGAGERRVVPAAVVAVMASTQPAFLSGFWHASLSTHFAILGMIGLYFRIVRGSRTCLAAACVAMPILLLVHPYLVAMDLAVLAAVPLTLFCQAQKTWRMTALAVAGSCACVAVVAIALGYQAGKSPGGYGRFSLNFLAPVFPAASGLIPGWTDADLDATGGQLAGDGYLGVGLILLVVTVLTVTWRDFRSACARHAGLALACLGLWLLALSTKIYAGKLLLLRLHTAAGPLEIIRTSSRLFWPVAYVLLVGSIATLAAKRPRLALILLPLAAGLQWFDGAVLRARDVAGLAVPEPWLFDPTILRGLSRVSTRMVVLPTYGCPPGQDGPLMQALWVASETRLPTNTAYVARVVHPQSCDMTAALAAAPLPGDLLVVQPAARAVVMQRPWAAGLCRKLSEYTICTSDAAVLKVQAGLTDARP